MKKNSGKILVQKVINDIRQELSFLEGIYGQIAPLIDKADSATEEEKKFYIRAAGSILHDFYTGLEKIFCDIAKKLTKDFPEGKDWHMKLLQGMAQQKKNVPVVISQKLVEDLKEYLGFRHLFRNIYGSQLDWQKLKILLDKIRSGLWPEIKIQLHSFLSKIKDS